MAEVKQHSRGGKKTPKDHKGDNTVREQELIDPHTEALEGESGITKLNPDNRKNVVGWLGSRKVWGRGKESRCSKKKFSLILKLEDIPRATAMHMTSGGGDEGGGMIYQ